MALAYPAGNRFALSTVDNRQAWLWITALLSLMYALIIAATRIIVKRAFYGFDDVALGLAYVLGLAHWIVIFLALGEGLGMTGSAVRAEAMARIGTLVFASRILLLLSTSLTKAAQLLFLRQLFTKSNDKAWLLCTPGPFVMISWTVASPLIVSVGCKPTLTVSAASDYCTADLLRWLLVAAIDFLLECSLVALPVFLFAPIQMSLARKLKVNFAFAFRLCDALLMLAYLTSYASFRAHGRPNIGIIVTLSWQEVLICFALVSATISILKGFVDRFTTADLARLGQSGSGLRSTQYPSQPGTDGAAFPLASISRSNRFDSGKSTSNTAGLVPAEAEAVTRTDVYSDGQTGGGGGGEADSIGSAAGSEQMIIYRRWDIRQS